MTPLIQTDDDAARLRAIALSWAGTPWTADGAVKGTGASCTMLPYAILGEFGHVAPLPPRRSGVLKCEILGVIQRWMESHPDLYSPVAHSEIRCGDVLVFNVGIGHAALCTGGTEMIHSWQTSGAHFSQFTETKLASRLVAAWRPLLS